MLSLTSYLVDSLLALASIASVLFAARAVQMRFLAGSEGSELVVVRAIVALSIVTVICYLLGTVGALSRLPVAVCLIASGIIAAAALGVARPTERKRERLSLITGAALLIGMALLLTIWLLPVGDALRHGLRGTDTLWYHMPFALRFYQTQSLTAFAWNEPLFQTYFYPSLGSMFHAVGMVFFDRDLLSPLLNIFWLGLLIAAAAAIGKLRGVAAASALAVAAVFSGKEIVGAFAGTAMVDVAATFFFLASIWLMLQIRGNRTALILSGLAIGLGVSTKMTIGIPALGMAIGILMIEQRGQRMRSLLIWGGAALATSWFWFARNIVETGTPLPMVKLPLLTGPGKALQSTTMVALSHYITNPTVMLHQLPYQWVRHFGPLAMLLLALAVIASLAITIRPPEKRWRAVGIVSLIAIGGYFFTPGTAAGPPGGPRLGIGWDTRFVLPGLSLGLVLVPVCLAQLWPSKRNWIAIPMVLLLIDAANGSKSWGLPHPLLTLVAVALLLVLLWLAPGLWDKLGSRSRLAAIALLGIALVGCGRVYESHQVAGRNSAYGLSSVGRAPARIALIGDAGTFRQYLLSDVKLQNVIQFIGIQGAHGALRLAANCPELRREINAGNYDYVVASPNRNIWQRVTTPNPQVAWIATDPAAKLVKLIPGLPDDKQSNGLRTPEKFPVYQITGQLDPAACPR